MQMGRGLETNACTRRCIGTIVCPIAWFWAGFVCRPAAAHPSLVAVEENERTNGGLVVSIHMAIPALFVLECCYCTVPYAGPIAAGGFFAHVAGFAVCGGASPVRPYLNLPHICKNHKM